MFVKDLFLTVIKSVLSKKSDTRHLPNSIIEYLFSEKYNLLEKRIYNFLAFFTKLTAHHFEKNQQHFNTFIVSSKTILFYIITFIFLNLFK